MLLLFVVRSHMSHLFSGRPGSPLGPLTAENVDANTLTLSWRPPKHIGNGPLTGFFIEKMLAGSWIVVSEVPPDTTTCHLDKLIEGAKYRFRVSAQNKHGKSDYLTMSDMIETRKLTGKKIIGHKVLRKHMYMMNCQAYVKYFFCRKADEK